MLQLTCLSSPPWPSLLQYFERGFNLKEDLELRWGGSIKGDVRGRAGGCGKAVGGPWRGWWLRQGLWQDVEASSAAKNLPPRNRIALPHCSPAHLPTCRRASTSAGP